MNRHAAWDAALRFSEENAAERLEVRVDLRPRELRSLRVPQARERFQRMEDTAVGEDPQVGDERLHLVTAEDRRMPPVRVLVDLLGQDAALEHAGRGVDDLERDRVVEHRSQRRVDMTDGSRSHLSIGTERQDELAQVARADLGHEPRAKKRQRMEAQARVVILGGP